jgi:radical SAM superfamily enzyme YgiQ (UPF0313 family)
MENLGVCYLSAVAKQTGAETRITSLEDATIVAGMWKPDVIGMSVMTGDQNRFISLAKKMRLILPSCKIIVGGPDVTFFPEGYGWADFTFPGEAETTLDGFLGGSYDKYQTIDSIPWPDRTDFPDMKIRDFITSRGCPHSCRYCFNAKWLKMYPDLPKVRFRSVDNVIAEIDSVRPEFVYFQDSCFGVSLKWLKDFSDQYKRRIGIPFHCHLRPSQVTQERVKLLKEANCLSVRIALETASDRLRKLIGREHTSNKEAIDAANILRAYDIKLMIQNMIGLCTSTIEEDLLTLEVNMQCKPDYAWASIFSPYPGTALGDECKEKGWYKGDYSDITDCFFDMSVLEFSDEYKMQTYLLQKVFALAVEAQCMPEISDLTYDNIFKFVHRAMRKIGDCKLYGGVL